MITIIINKYRKKEAMLQKRNIIVQTRRKENMIRRNYKRERKIIVQEKREGGIIQKEEQNLIYEKIMIKDKIGR